MPVNFRFIHSADLHLGSAFHGVHQSNPRVAAALREATYVAFNRIIQHALDNQVDFVLFAGDIYNENENSLQPQLRFRDGVQRLHDAGIASCVVRGNHDPYDGTANGLQWPATCRLFEPKAGEPAIMRRRDIELALVSGISYGRRDQRESLAKNFSHGNRQLFRIGLLHTNCGANAAHANYAPSTVEELRGYNFDYWALGHIHKPAVLSSAAPVVAYAGSPQGLTPKETGAHGFYQVDVDAAGVATLRFVEACEVLWRGESLDAAPWLSQDDALSSLESTIEQVRLESAGRACLLRLQITGRSALHGWLNEEGTLPALLSRLRGQSGSPFVWLDKLGVATAGEADLAARRHSEDIIGEVLRQGDALGASPEGRAAAREVLKEFFTNNRVRNYVDSDGEDAWDGQLAQWIGRAATMAAEALLQGEEAA